MIFISFHHVLYSVHMSGIPFRKVRYIARTISQSMRLLICLIHQIDSVLVAQLIPQCRLRIVRCTHGINIQFFHQLYIAHHHLAVYNLPCLIIIFVQIDSFKVHLFAINKDLRIFDFYFTETYFARCNLYNIVFLIFQRDQQSI